MARLDFSAENPHQGGINRRHLLAAGGGTLGAWFLNPTVPAGKLSVLDAAESTTSRPRFRYCLNTSTIREKKLPLDEIVQLAAEAGYDGIEPWTREIQAYQESGKSLSDLGKKIADLGLTVESAIGFAAWIVDDEQQRREALESARRDMQLVREIGGQRIAAPPVGATRQTDLDLFRAAERYRALLEVGRQEEVVPQLELWGFSSSLSRLGELVFVATEAAHPDACLLPDVYHIYKGGSDFAGLSMINGQRMHVFHINDYPADPPREKISDADRVYPGDGIAPLSDILQRLAAIGFRGALSLELFNREYWRDDPRKVARLGLEKMQAATARAGV